MILIPVKNLANAKQRLSPMLDQTLRAELAQTMLQDVAASVAAWRGLPCALVSSDQFALEVAKQYNFGIIPDSDNSGETHAIEVATQLCVTHGAKSTLVIPADIPLVQAGELDEILRRAPAQGSVLVPAADGRGTNAALRRPANLFPLRFGNDSFKPHLAAAQATAKPCEVAHLAGIALDVDNPQDLEDLLASPGQTRTHSLLRKWLEEGRLSFAEPEPF